MGTAERKERQRAELREQILVAARRIVLDEGFEALTMRKLADAIEYSPGTIYLYFENREGIGQQLCSESFEHLLRYMAAVGGIADPRERLLAIGRSYARFGLENPKEYRLLFMTDSRYTEAFFPPEHAKDPNDPGYRAFEFVASSVREAQVAGQVVAGDADMIAEMLWTAVHGIVSMAVTCSHVLETPAEQLVDTLCRTIVAGLTPAPPAVRAAS